MRERDIRKLAELAALRALKAAMEVKTQDQEGERLRAMISDLQADPSSELYPTAQQDLREAQTLSAWQTWRIAELRRLHMQLARHEVRIAPVKTRAAKATAQEQVIMELLNRRSARGRAGP